MEGVVDGRRYGVKRGMEKIIVGSGLGGGSTVIAHV